MTDRPRFTDRDLLYAATARCRCGAGLAYPTDHSLSMEIRAWVCSAVLRGDVEDQATDQTLVVFRSGPAAGEHDAFPWNFFKVREETSINNTGGHTTRPPGTVARTIGKAKCPKCDREWQSEPYSACGLGHHWFPGPCPGCGYAVGAHGTYHSDEGEPIKVGCPDVVLEVPLS